MPDACNFRDEPTQEEILKRVRKKVDFLNNNSLILYDIAQQFIYLNKNYLEHEFVNEDDLLINLIFQKKQNGAVVITYNKKPFQEI